MRDFANPSSRPAHADRARQADPLLGRALALVRYLRERCPWDARQDPLSLRPYLLEEAHEVADAIEAGDDPSLAAELGDLLLNLAFQIVLAEERGAFGAGEVVARLEHKMEVRHPHVYGDAEAPPDWESLKAGGRAALDPFQGVSRGLEPLSRALRLQDRAAGYGFDWPDARGALDKVREEAAELEAIGIGTGSEDPAEGDAAASDRPANHPGETDPAESARRDRASRTREEIGDLLFAAVNVARLCGVHPGNALTAANRKFERRFRELAARAARDGLEWESATPAQLDALWEAAKRDE
ncbi:MAG: YabN family protein [Gemmatimonadota bacterium]